MNLFDERLSPYFWARVSPEPNSGDLIEAALERVIAEGE